MAAPASWPTGRRSLSCEQLQAAVQGGCDELWRDNSSRWPQSPSPECPRERGRMCSRPLSVIFYPLRQNTLKQRACQADSIVPDSPTPAPAAPTPWGRVTARPRRPGHPRGLHRVATRLRDPSGHCGFCCHFHGPHAEGPGIWARPSSPRPAGGEWGQDPCGRRGLPLPRDPEASLAPGSLVAAAP